MYQPPAQQPYRRATTRVNMPLTLAAFHWLMIFCTGGLWIPVYLASKRRRKITTTWQ